MSTQTDTSAWSALRRLSFWLYTFECEWVQNGVYFILGYRPGDNLPWWSPARITLIAANVIETKMAIGRLQKY